MTLKGLIENDLFLGHVIPDLAHNIAETVRGNRAITFSGPRGKSMKRTVVTDIETATPRRVRQRTYAPRRLYMNTQAPSAGPTMSSRAAPGGARKTLHAGRMQQSNIGMPLGFKPSKKAQQQIVICTSSGTPAGTVFPDKTMFGGPITAVGQVFPIPLVSVPYDASSPDSLNTRSTTYVGHRGIKMEMLFRRHPGATLPITIHYAVLTDRQGTFATDPMEQFFMASDSRQNQGENFFPQSGRVWEYNKVLNTRQNHVVLHNRLTIGISNTNNSVDTQLNMLKKRKHYIKTNKQLEFPETTGDDSDKPKQNYYLVFWYYAKDSIEVGEEIADDVGSVNIPTIAMRLTNYWTKSNMYS